MAWEFLERDSDLLDQLDAGERAKVESILTSHGLEGLVPERHQTEAFIALWRGDIDQDTYLARFTGGPDAEEASVAKQ